MSPGHQNEDQVFADRQARLQTTIKEKPKAQEEGENLVSGNEQRVYYYDARGSNQRLRSKHSSPSNSGRLDDYWWLQRLGGAHLIYLFEIYFKT